MRSFSAKKFHSFFSRSRLNEHGHFLPPARVRSQRAEGGAWNSREAAEEYYSDFARSWILVVRMYVRIWLYRYSSEAVIILSAGSWRSIPRVKEYLYILSDIFSWKLRVAEHRVSNKQTTRSSVPIWKTHSFRINSSHRARVARPSVINVPYFFCLHEFRCKARK